MLYLLSSQNYDKVTLIFDYNSYYKNITKDYINFIINMKGSEIIYEFSLVGNETDNDLLNHIENIALKCSSGCVIFDLCDISEKHLKLLNLIYDYLLTTNSEEYYPYQLYMRMSTTFVYKYIDEEIYSYIYLYSPYSIDLDSNENKEFISYMKIFVDSIDYITHSASVTYSYATILFDLLNTNQLRSGWYNSILNKKYNSPHGEIQINNNYYTSQMIKVLTYDKNLGYFTVKMDRNFFSVSRSFTYNVNQEGYVIECSFEDKENIKKVDAITIGFIHPLTGKFYSKLYYVFYLFQIAVDNLNEEGGIMDKRIKLFFRDTADDYNIMEKNIKILIEYKIIALFGGYPYLFFIYI